MKKALFGSIVILTVLFVSCSGSGETEPPGQELDSVVHEILDGLDELLETAGNVSIDGVQQLVSQQSTEIMIGTPYIGVTSRTPGGFDTCIQFSANNRIEMWDEEMYGGSGRRNARSGTYSINNRYGLDFMTISWSGGAREEYLYLLNNSFEELFLYTSNSTPFFGPSPQGDMRGFNIFGDDSWVRASSSFRETIGGRAVVYTPERLGARIGECWVPVNEINERLILSIASRYQMTSEDIFISSGFVSFSNPNLYTDNSRIRSIRLSDNSGNSRIVELLDTPHFQPISLSGIGSSGESSAITLEILDVYPGTRYRHTCVNSIFWKGMM